MRIECTQCSAKYNVSEEKLEQGEVRLKCKQCRTLLVIDESGGVRGAPPTSDQGATRVGRRSVPPTAALSPSDTAVAERTAEQTARNPAQSEVARGSDVGAAEGSRADAKMTGAKATDVTDAKAADADGPPDSSERTGGIASEANERPSRPSKTRAQPRLDPSDAHATIPLPPLSELGLGPSRGIGAPLPPPVTGPRDGTTPAPTAAAAPPVNPPIPDADLDASPVDAPEASPRTSSPPRPMPAAQPRMVPTPSEAPTLFLDAQSNDTPNEPPTVTLSFRLPPVKKWGWGLIASLTLLGLLLGAGLAGSPDRSHLAAFDPIKARQVLSDATGRSLACFEEGIPDLEGSVELLVTPDGEVEAFNAQGKLASSVRIECVRDYFEAAEFEPFSGAPVRVQRRIAIGNPAESAN